MSDDKRRGTVKLSQYNEQAQVAPSATRDGSIAVGFYNAEGTEPVHPGCFTGDEWDAFVAAGNAALGRGATPPTLATYFEEKAKVCDAGRAHGRATGNADLEACSKAEAATWRHAASLAVEASREAGPTVPRAAVAAVRERFDKWIREEGGKRNDYVEGMTVGIKDAILALDALLAPAPEGDQPC